MNQINIIPKIIHDKFAARIIMDDYDIEKPIVITVVARRNDGEYNTQILTYPTSGVDYEGNVRMVFFDVARSHVCQITSVFINGHEVKTYYTDVPDLDMQARYDDSLCRYDKKVNMNDIRLSFQVLETRDPKVLQVLDESEWGLLEDRKAIIEITTPGMSDPVTLFLGKNQVNTFTSLTLGLNCFNYDDCNVKYLDLPDGIYDIKIIGSPSTYNFSRKYLKTDLIRRRLDRLWIKTDILCEDKDKDLINKIQEMETLMVVAEANVRLDKEKALKAERERIERSMMNHSSSTVVSDMEYASRSTAGCMVMLDPLKTMERDVVSIYKQTRTIGDVGIVYLNMQKKIREWIKNLPYGCPPDEEVQEMRKEILDGRAKYIKP